LENIVRGQVSSHSDTTPNNNINDTRNDQTQTNTSQDIQHDENDQSQPRSQESDMRHLPNQTNSSESNLAAVNMNWQETANQGEGWQEQVADDERGNWRQSNYSQLDEWRGSNAEPLDVNWQENSVNEWSRETPGNVLGEQGHPQESQELWRGDSTREAVQNWTEGPSDPLRTHRSVPTRRFNRFHPPDDDNVYSMELRELLSR
jgi:hypothetical protein